MRLWLLSANENQGYDTYDSFVVRATTEEGARALAADMVGPAEWTYNGRERDVFLSPSRSTCEPLTTRGKAEVVLGSFNAG